MDTKMNEFKVLGYSARCIKIQNEKYPEFFHLEKDAKDEIEQAKQYDAKCFDFFQDNLSNLMKELSDCLSGHGKHETYDCFSFVRRKYVLLHRTRKGYRMYCVSILDPYKEPIHAPDANLGGPNQ